MKVKITGNRLLVRIIKLEAKGKLITQDAIIAPNFLTGEVVAVGTGLKFSSEKTVPLDFEIGDKILYHNVAGIPMMLDNERFFLVDARDVVSKIIDK